MKPYYQMGYTVALDNWFTSPTLFHKLINEKINAVGTVRMNRKNMPKEFKSMHLKKGEMEVLYCRGIAAYKWKDKKEVHVLSTYHKQPKMVKTGKMSMKTKEAIVKPQAVIDYNKQMNAVDRQDQQLASFSIMRRYAKGYRKIFFYIMDMALYNSYVLFQKVRGKKLLFDDFRENVAEQILERVNVPEYRRRGRPTSGPSPIRFQAANWAHFPNRIPSNAVKKNPSRICELCKQMKKKSESRWECEKCKVALHLPECFKKYHSKETSRLPQH
ncbi:piggyBac transposable element-derived protein 4-like [Ischnura elegans]|uniref:piggyBac transposable element-derived protein 4-like n=1 Tax=Ischnura elegans TaxID=197161 RepID=UPI001ED88E91|nr:piggyBac transposable element-derived protein 4-like [Ischnura elegans]